jgi:hypothetical protein
MAHSPDIPVIRITRGAPSGKLFADQIVEESAMAGDCPADAQTVAAPNPLTG